MAVPVVQATTTLAGASGTSAVIDTTPLGIVAGDTVLVFLYKENSGAITPPAGYTQKAQVATTAVSQHTLFWHTATGSESGTITFSWSTSDWRGAVAVRISGALTTGDPLEATNTAFSNTAVATSPAVSIGSTSTDTLLVFSATNFNGGNSYTPPTGYTENADVDVISGAWKANAAGGATGSVTSAFTTSGVATAIIASVVSGPPPAAGDSAPVRVAPLLLRAFRAPFATPFQLLGDRTPAALAYTGSADSATTVTVTAAGTVGVAANVAETATITAAGVVAAFSDAAAATTVSITAAGTLDTASDPNQAPRQIAWMFLQPNAASVQLRGDTSAANAFTRAADTATTVAVTAAGVVAVTASSTVATAVGMTANGVVGLDATATRAVTVTVDAAGTVGAAGTGSATVATTATLTADGVVATTATATRTVTATITAAGQTGTVAAATVTETVTITAAGTVTTGFVGNATRTTTTAVTAAGLIAANASSSRDTTLTITADGVVATVGTATRTVTVTIAAAGVAAGVGINTHPTARAGTATGGPRATGGTATGGPTARAGSSSTGPYARPGSG